MAVALPTQTAQRFQAARRRAVVACAIIGGAASTASDAHCTGTGGGLGSDSLPAVKSPVAMPPM